MAVRALSGGAQHRFVLHLALCSLAGLSRKTLLLHRDHIRVLGEEVMRRLKPDLRRRNMVPVLFVFIDEDGGPVIYPPTNSPNQRSFDTTCLKLRIFLLDTKLDSK